MTVKTHTTLSRVIKNLPSLFSQLRALFPHPRQSPWQFHSHPVLKTKYFICIIYLHFNAPVFMFVLVSCIFPTSVSAWWKFMVIFPSLKISGVKKNSRSQILYGVWICNISSNFNLSERLIDTNADKYEQISGVIILITAERFHINVESCFHVRFPLGFHPYQKFRVLKNLLHKRYILHFNISTI